MLLVDHDQPQLGDGREHSRARPHADPRLALAQPPPLLVALPGGHARVQHRDGVAEPRAEARHDLRRQGDLRHHHDHAPPAGERLLGRPQVHLGLAGAGDAVQQRAPGGPLAQRRQQRLERGPLVVRELGRVRGGRADGAVARRLARAAPAPAETLRRAGRQHEAQRAGERRAVLVGQEARQLDQLGGDPGLEHAERLEQPLAGQLALGRELDDDAEQLAGAERHHEHRADAHRRGELLADQVVERAAQGAGGRDRLDACDRRGRAAAHADAPRRFRRGRVLRRVRVSRGGGSHRPDPRSETGGGAQRLRPCRCAPT